MMNVPKLRFKGFCDEWKLSNLDEYINVDSGIALKSEEISEDATGIPILRGINITEGYIRHKEEIDRYYLGNEKKIAKYLLNVNDIVLGMDGSKVGKNVAIITKADDKSILIQRVARIKPKGNLNYNYLYQQIFNSRFHRYVDKVNTSSGIPHISLQQIRDFIIPVPSTIEEQKKIAQFFSVIDKKIEALKKKKELLEQYKKGVMQKIFSQDLRFKDEKGNNFPDWDCAHLKDYVKIYDGTHQTPNYVSRGIPFYSVEHITSNNFSKTKFIEESVYERENLRVKLEKGDILMTRIGDIGTSKLIDWDVTASFYVSLALLKSSEKINSAYLNQYIKTKEFQNELWKRTIHVAFPKKINLGEIGECSIRVPTINEQQKIADFLTALDKKIDLVDQQISKTEHWKKGLLQQMFV